jgi:hypothetical protein
MIAECARCGRRMYIDVRGPNDWTRQGPFGVLEPCPYKAELGLGGPDNDCPELDKAESRVLDQLFRR